MQIKKNAILIVNINSTSEGYAPVFFGLGYFCIHIKTHLHQKKDYGQFCQEQMLCTDISMLNQVIKKLKSYIIKAVIVGSDEGLYIADQIAEYFDVAKSDVKTSALRRDKFLMTHALSQAKLPCAQQFKSTNCADLIAWFHQSGFKKIVMKPTHGAHCEGVAFCETETDIKNNYEQFYGKFNITGEINHEFVLQEYLDGPQYIVNTVTCRGEHLITDIWYSCFAKNLSTPRYLYMDLMNPEHSEYALLANYVKKALDAVGLMNGPAHSEVKLTPTGPKLIEINPRLAGATDFSAVHDVLGHSQISLAVAAVLSPEYFLEQIKSIKTHPKKQVRLAYLYSNKALSPAKEPHLSEVLNLKSFYALNGFPPCADDLWPQAGKKIFDLGYVSLVSEEACLIRQDYTKIREYERKFI